MSKNSMAKGKGKAGFRRGNTLMMEPDKNPPKRVEPYVVPRRREPPPPRPIPFTPVPLFEITENPQEWKKVSAMYPADAKRDGITAVVVLSVAIRRNGRVRWAKVVSIRPPQAKRYDFGRAAVKALRRYRFRPAKLKGKPVDVIVRYIYRFELDD
ncbi:MAG: energy transducer TonB [Deltaproteobacteria bacterium]|nr:MAG: energy transducer TonB [Deltaproteobacteria bacterium]